MKKIAFATISILISLIAVTLLYFFTSTKSNRQLTPETMEFIVKHSKPSDLNNNAYLQMLALHLRKNDNQSSYQDAKELYLEYERNQTADTLQQFYLFPDINRKASEHLLFCIFADEECIKFLQDKRQALLDFIKQQQTTLTSYRAISQLDNFDPLRYPAASRIVDSIRFINVLLTIEILFLIENNQLDTAVENLAQVLTIFRKALAKSNHLKSLHLEAFYNQHIVLIQKLKQAGNTNWQPILAQLQPMSFNTVITENARNFRTISEIRDLLSHPYTKAISSQQLQAIPPSKKDALNTKQCIAIIIERNNRLAVKVTNKRNLSTAINALKPQYQKVPDQELAYAENNPICHSVISTVTTDMNIKWALAGNLAIDQTNQLLRLIIASQQTSLEQLLTQPQWKDPYSGKPPFIEQNSVCYPDEIEGKPECVGLF